MRRAPPEAALPLHHPLSLHFFSFAPDDALQKKGVAYARLRLSPPGAVFSIKRSRF
jgi:hypothetical protein